MKHQHPNIPKLNDTELDKWVIDRENNGIPERSTQMPFVNCGETVKQFEKEICKFVNESPKFDLIRYGDILERTNI